MSDEEVKLSESAWARGWADTRRWVHTVSFWALEVLGGSILGIITESPSVVLIYVVGILAAFWLGATVSAPIRQRDEARAFIVALHSIPALSIIFPKEANQPNKISSFRTITRFLLRDTALAPPHPSQHAFYLGVTNNTGRTVRQVGIRVIQANIPNRPMNLDLLEKNTERSKIDIAPRLTELFRLGAVMRREDRDIIDKHEVLDGAKMASVVELASAHEKHFIGLIIPHAKGKEALLRNDGQVLRLVAHGEDVQPAVADVIINMRHDITVEIRSIDTDPSVDGYGSAANSL